MTTKPDLEEGTPTLWSADRVERRRPSRAVFRGERTPEQRAGSLQRFAEAGARGWARRHREIAAWRRSREGSGEVVVLAPSPKS